MESEINNYDTRKWAEQTVTGKKIFLLNFAFNGHEIPKMKLIEAAEAQLHNDSIHSEYYWQNPAAPDEVIKIDIIEATDWISAQSALQADLSGRMGLNTPTAGSKNVKVGDVAYIGNGELLQSMVFCRANLVIKLNSIGKTPVAVNAAAAAIDNLFVREPDIKPLNVKARNRVSLSVQRQQVKTGSPVELNITTSAPDEKPVWHRFSAASGHFVRSGKQVTFIPEATGEEKIKVNTFNESGSADQNTVNLSVG